MLDFRDHVIKTGPLSKAERVAVRKHLITAHMWGRIRGGAIIWLKWMAGLPSAALAAWAIIQSIIGLFR